jgi:hypothetical protein
MTIEVYHTSQREEWRAILEHMNGADIYFTPEYCRIAENNDEGTAYLFVYRENGLMVCYPFLLRRINDLPLAAARDLREELFDIVTPYGYGGPLTNAENDSERLQLMERFSEAFGGYCRDKRIVTEFVRFHPIMQNHRYYQTVNPTNIRHTVCMDLTNPDQDVLASLTPPCRNRVRYAVKHGLTVHREDPQNLGIFLELYYATMDKNNANVYYYFPEKYFRDSVELLRDYLNLFTVKMGDTVIVSAIFLHYRDYVTYHLTGSNKDYLSYAPYNLLICHAGEWFKARGGKYLHLGGGYRGNDDLFRFKSTFIRQDPLDFYIGRKVHCPEIYEMLLQNVNVPGDYFPIYRHPSLCENSTEI